MLERKIMFLEQGTPFSLRRKKKREIKIALKDKTGRKLVEIPCSAP